MLEVRDTFLKFLNTELPSITIHPLRFDPEDPDSAGLAMNALNVQFLNIDLGVDLSTQHTVLDCVSDSENACISMMNDTWTVLNARFFCPLFDYTVPSSPVALHTNIMWDRKGVKFRNVHSDYYCHYTCSLKLVFHPS